MLNKTIIHGRLTKDVELRRTNSGIAVASFTVAWSEKHKDNEQKLFMPCVAWRNTAEFASKYFVKGQEVIAEGKLSSRKWQDKNGNDRETVELVVDQLHFCGSRKETQQDNFNALSDRVQEFDEIGQDCQDGDLPF